MLPLHWLFRLPFPYPISWGKSYALFVVICIAASASFSTPIGYQTNLIVQGIGNYKFMDFVRIGLPLNILTFIISVILIPLIWPFDEVKDKMKIENGRRKHISYI